MMSHSQTDVRGGRDDDVKQAADLASNSPSGAIKNPAVQPTPPAERGDRARCPCRAGAALPAVPQGNRVASKPVAALPQNPLTPAPVLASLPGARACGGCRRPPANQSRAGLRAGEWTFQGMALASPRNEVGVLRLPVPPPAEYRLTLVVQRMFPLQPLRTTQVRPPLQSRSRYSSRTLPPAYRNVRPPAQGMPQPVMESDEGLDIVLSVDGHPAAVVLDGWQRTTSGLELVNGKGVDENGTAFHGELLPRMNNVTVICTVGPGSVDAMVDGRTILHWTGRSDRLSIEAGLAADIGNSLALISSSQFRVQRMELVPLSRSAAPSTGPAVVTTSAGPGAGSAIQGPPAPGGLPAAPGPAALAGRTPVAVHSTRHAVSAAVPSPEAVQCVALIEHPLGSGSGFAVGRNLW